MKREGNDATLAATSALLKVTLKTVKSLDILHSESVEQ